jgi:hypothetical protein
VRLSLTASFAVCLGLVCAVAPLHADVGLVQSCIDTTPAGSSLPTCRAYALVHPEAETLVASRTVGATCNWNGDECTWKRYDTLTSVDEARTCTVDISPGRAWTLGDPCRDGSGAAYQWIASESGAVDVTWDIQWPTQYTDNTEIPSGALTQVEVQCALSDGGVIVRRQTVAWPELSTVISLSEASWFCHGIAITADAQSVPVPANPYPVIVKPIEGPQIIRIPMGPAVILVVPQ